MYLASFVFVGMHALAAAGKTTNRADSKHLVAHLNGPDGAPRGHFRFFPVYDEHNKIAGVQINGLLTNFNASLGPFPWHIHTNPVASSILKPDDCMAAGGHFDTKGVPDNEPCDPSTPETCQDGNLSGKYGAIAVTGGTDFKWKFSKVDRFLTVEGLHGRSIVIHDKEKKRQTCANIVQV